jgi:hypothetical protein
MNYIIRMEAPVVGIPLQPQVVPEMYISVWFRKADIWLSFVKCMTVPR